MAIEVIAKIKQKNNGSFFLMDAEDVEYKGQSLVSFIPVVISQEDYDALPEKDPNTIYLIAEEWQR